MTEIEVAIDALKRFERLGLNPVIGGSVASSAWGNPRQTNDLDLSLNLKGSQMESFIQEFEADYMLSRVDIEESIANMAWPSGFQLMHFSAALKIDVFLEDDGDFPKSVRDRARTVEFAPGVYALYASAEDIVVMKLRWYQLGNRVSDRQWNDLLHVIEVQKDAFDRGYVLKWSESFGLKDLATEALNEAKTL